MKTETHYERLEIGPTASADEVKRAFRQQIARYHPDKVHHLGREFQELAATRAAELTEAYQVLSRAERRGEYDATLATASSPAASASVTHPVAPVDPPESAPTPTSAPADPFARERAGRDILLRRACLDRLRRALARLGDGAYEESTVRGFDIACVPRSRLFGRRSGPRLLGAFVPHVDAAAVATTWSAARRWDVPPADEVCVILMGTAVAPQSELSQAIDVERRRPARGARLSLIPVDASHWEARLPPDAPEVARMLIQHLRTA